MGNPLQTLHKSLLDNNYDVPEDYNSFERTLTAKGDEGYQNRFQLWKSLRDNNYDVPDNYDDFRDTLFTARQPEPSTYKPTAREMAGFQQTIGQATQAGQGATVAYDRRASNLQKRQGLRAPQRVTLGESNNLVEGEQHLNPETGELEQSYITSAGNEYQNKTIADQEQRQIDQAMRDERYRKSLPGQLDDAYAERDRLNAELAQHQGQWVDQDGRVHYGNRGDDESVAALEAALRQNQQRITALEAERDDDGGTQFWRGFVDAAMNPSVQTFGLTDFNDTVQLMRVKQKIDQAHDAGQEPELSSAEQKLIESTFLNNDAQQKYGENRGFMYRAGGISMQALPFVAEFMTTGGFSALSEAGAKYGAKAAEKLALDGLSKMFVKNLGVLAGDVAAGWAMANTTGAFRTASDIMQRNMGEVTINPEGQYDFGSYDEEGNFTRGGKSLGRSIYEAEVANTLEYYTEKLGEHLQLGKWIAKGAEKMGLSKLSKAVNYLSSSKWLERGGIQDYPSEVVEEQANLLLNAMLVGDNNFSLGPIKALSNDVLGTDFKVDRNSKEYKESVFNGKTQGDIWGGMMFSIGLMQAPRLAYTGKSAINYYQAKKTVDMADTNASIVFGEDNWASVKQQIDDCDNEQMGDMIASIATGDMNSTEKTAALNYAGDLLKMRGYNMGMMADAKDEQSSMSEEAIVSQSIDQSYGQGYNAQEPDEMKQIVDDAQASGEMLSSFGEEFSKMVMDGQEEPVQTMNYLMQNRDLYTDEQIAAAADYFQKQAAANGVMDAALDNVDMQVEQANAQVRGNAHQESGNLVMAKMGDLDYYVVGGEITPDGDLVGTGGAVLLKDPITGEVSVQSPANVMVYEMTPVDELIQQNETVLRQQLTQQADDDINFGSPANEVFDMEDTVSLMDGEGGVIEGQVVQLPNAVDGVFVIQTSDGRALQMTADDMNRRIVAHNGAEVERTVAQPVQQPDNNVPENIPNQGENVPNLTENIPNQGENVPNLTENVPNQGENVPNQDENVPQSALSRIPVKTDASGQPVKGKNGRPVLEWHKATVEDAASALIETAGGDMLTARDTASDLVNVARGKLEKIRKQKPKGEDPIEIAESRQAIKQQEQEQQAIIKQWQDVNQDIQRRMQAEAAERQAAIEAAKSEEQRQREAEEARKLKEQQEEQDRKRLREQIEKDKERRNKQYDPLVQARREMADDAEALSVLEDIEPRSLDEYVSSLLRPHSMLWQDASDSERGLQTELGLKRSDMQRMMTLLGTKESGAKPFGQVVLDIHEGLPQGMKEMYSDEDVRNTLLDLFNEGSSTRMLHLTEEHRIEEARQMKEENQRRAEEAEMDAWAEAYHLTPEEREAFEAYMQEPPTLVEQEVINQIIADNEQNRTSPAVGKEPVSGAVPAGIEGSQSQVQTAAEAEGGRNTEEGLAQGEEAASNQPSVSDDDVSGTVRDRESLAILFDQIGASPVLAERMSDYDVEQLTALVEDLEIANDEYGQTIEENKDALKSKSKETREAAQKAIDDAQEQANAVFVPIEKYVEGLNVKYGIESEEPFEGAIPTPKIDNPRYEANRQALIDAYKSGDPATITAAAQAVQQYVDEGLDAGEDHTEIFDIAEDYNGNDPEKLADQYIIRTFWDRYLDNDVDPEYIKTGIKQSEQLKPTDMRDAVRVESPEIGVSEANARAKEAAGEPQSIGTGDFGDIYDQFRGKPQEAIDFLIKKKGGEALGALSHKDIGDIDLVWGEEGTGHSDGYGLAKLVKYHPEVLNNLQGILDDMEVVKRTDNRINLESDKYKAAVRLTWNEQSKTWLLTVFEKKNSALDNTTDTDKTSNRGKRNDTATPQGTVSESKDTNNFGNDQENLGKTSSAEEISSEEAKVDTNPSEGQKEAGNYQKGHIKIDGLDITIENPKGSIRRGTDADGKQWEVVMHNTYGYIRGTEGADKDHIDVFLSDDPTHPDKVFIVQQRKKVNGVWKFDELKVLLGFENASQASNAYLSNYEEGWNGMDALIETDMESFKDWLKNGKQKGTYKEDGTWAKVYPGVSTMVADEGEMPEPEQQEVQVLRGTGNNRLPGVGGELPEVPGGYGATAISQGDPGQNRREQGLQQGELQVDRLDNPVSEPKDGTLSDIQGQDNVNAAVGRGNGASAEENKIQNPDVPLERGENTGNSGRNQGQLQNGDISGQDNENGRLGEGTQSELQNVEEQTETGLVNGTNSHNADEHKASGRVNAASRREQVLLDALVEHMQGSGLSVVTDAEEGQRVLDEFNGRLTDDVKQMGSRVDSKKKLLSDEIGQRELTEAQQKVVDVYTGKSDNQPLTFLRDGNELTVRMRQGNEQGAGTKHSLFRHYGTGTGVITADDVMRIPDVLADGERTEKERGNVKLANYRLRDENGVRYTVVTEIKKSGEVFNDFYTNKKASNQTPQMPNGDTPEGARTNDLNASSDAKVQQNPDTTKDSEEKIKEQKAREVSMKPIDADIPNNPTIRESLDIMDRVKDMPIEKVLEAYNRLNSQMLEEGGLNVDEHEMKVKREWMAEHGTEGLGQTMADHLKYLSDKYGYGKLQLRWELLDRLEKAGIDPRNTTSSPGNTTAKLVTMRPKFFKTPDGQAYGYTYQGKIYIDPRIATSETPIHEYGHLWTEMKRQSAPEEWAEIKQAILNDKLIEPVLRKVRDEYPELEGREDDFVEEVLTQFSGKRGAERLREVAEQVAQENGGVFGKAEAVTAMQRLKNALNRFWASVARMLGVKYRNANDVADMVMKDFLDGVNPREQMKDGADRLSEMRVYHGSAAEFDRFDHTKVGSGEGQAVYLNIRNPKRVEDVPEDWDETHSEWWSMQIYQAVREGYDGIVYENKYEDPSHPADSWIAFSPEQIKSATDNVGTYDSTRKDIRYREQERFEDGQLFPIHTTFRQSSYNVLGGSRSYSIDLMPDEYTSEQSLLDAVRNQYPEYFATIEDGSVKMESWSNVMKEAAVARQRASQKGAKNFIERKTRNVIDAVTYLAERMNLNVEVLTTTEELTGKKARAKGWFNSKTGKITLVLPNHSNQSDLINTLLHEGVAHFGLRKMFGADFNTFLDNVYNHVSPEIKARIDAAIKRNGWSRHEATEEYLARLAERTDFEHAAESGWWQKIKDFFFEMLGKAGFNTSLTDNELRYILWRSYDNLLHPDSRRNIFDKAREVQMQSRLRVGPYSERERQRIQRTGRIDTSRVATVADNVNEDFSLEDDEKELFSIRTKEPPKKTGIGYKVFVLKDGQLYPPMVANPGGEGTPVGVWLDADAAPVAGTSKTGRPQVKAGGKGTQGGSGQLAYRPGWHLGTIPYALQFNRKDSNGERTLFPNNFVWAEVEYADDVDYQDEARQEGINANGKYQHSLAGLKHVPTDGSYKYRTNPDPRTDEWIITGAMRVNKILNRDEVDNLVRQAGREPQPIQAGDILTQEAVDELNAEIQSTKEADEMGLLMRDDSAWDDVAKESYEKEVATKSLQWQESWQDSMASLKAIQDAIAKESGHVATGAEDAYHYENRMHGRAKNMTEQYDWRFYRPMLKAFNDFCKAKGLTHEQGMDYLIAKSGLERNVYYAFRDAVKSKLAEDIKDMREKLEKDYSKNRIDEKEYKSKKADIDLLEKTGVDDRMQQVRGSDDYLQAKEDYANGHISYNEYLSRIEDIIRRETNGKYDEYMRDYSGLTETFNKEMYNAAQRTKKQAQRAIDPQERRELWGEYDAMMKQAYEQAREEAEKRVFDAEGGDGQTVASTLWKRINAATEETLKHSYESGLMDRNTYHKVRKMFDFYLPLRGWDENKASDVYTYMGRENVFSPAVKKTWGRTSKAEDPLAYIGNIAVSTILSGHRNMLKQHFLNYVMNNPTSLVSISESWYENIGTEDDHPVWVLRSADTAGKSADEIADIVNDFNEEMRLKQRDGKAIPVTGRLRLDVHATSGQKAEHVVEVQRAGHTYQLYINGDPKAAQALNGSAARAVSRISDTTWGKRIAELNRSMAAFFTSKNPAFVISNLSRDLNMAMASVAVNENAAYNAMFLKNIAKVLTPRMGESSRWMPASKQPTGLIPSLMRKWQQGKLDTGNETERLFKEFMDEGGETGFVNMLSIDSFKEKMQKEISQMNGSTLFGSKAKVKETSIGKAFRLLGDTFEFYNRCAEDATRFMVYMTSRQMGKTLEESIADAKDVTLNFNRKGTGAKGNAELRDLYIFVNPAIQALANMYRMAKKHPLKLGGVAAGFMLMGIFSPVLNQWLLNMFGDDDDKDAYWNLPPWVRKNNLVFWVPGTKYFFTMPLAQEFRVFYGVGEMISSGVMEHPHQNTGVEILESVADLVPINPTGNGGNLVINFLPTTTQPILQVAFNTDFTGKPIWKDNMGNKYDPMFTKAYASTPKWMTKVSEGINLAAGGDEDSRGWLDKTAAGQYLNNPAVWNHLLQGYLGGMYNTIAKSADVVVTVARQEAPNAYQIPVLNRFVNSPWERDNSGALGEDYWQMINDNEEFLNTVRKKKKRAKAGDAEAQKKLEKLMASDEYQQSLVISQYKKLIDNLRKQQKETTDKDTLANIKSSISMYKNDLLDEIAALESGKDPLELAIGKFDATEDAEKRKAIALRISKEAGASETPYGDKPKNDHQRLYQELRTGEDVYEDALLLAYQQKLGEEGNEQQAKAISNQRKSVHSNVVSLFGGKGDKYVMEGIRAARKAMIERLELNKKPDSK